MEENKQIEKTKDADQARDWFLSMFVGVYNNITDEASMGVTLLSHGFLISGQLIGVKTYFKGISGEFEEAFGKDTESAKQLAETVAAMGQNSTPNENGPVYIHLKDAKFYHTNGSPIPQNRGVYWRGRITEISGFSLGNLSADPR